ncbi:MAG: hypothetical protein ACRDNP_01810 [Gaiellaceae bacterium]
MKVAAGSKLAATTRARRLLAETPLGAGLTGEDLRFMFSLLLQHPSAEQKIGTDCVDVFRRLPVGAALLRAEPSVEHLNIADRCIPRYAAPLSSILGKSASSRVDSCSISPMWMYWDSGEHEVCCSKNGDRKTGI